MSFFFSSQFWTSQQTVKVDGGNISSSSGCFLHTGVSLKCHHPRNTRMMVLSPVPSFKRRRVEVWSLKMCTMVLKRTFTDSGSRFGWVMESLCWHSCGWWWCTWWGSPGRAAWVEPWVLVDPCRCWDQRRWGSFCNLGHLGSVDWLTGAEACDCGAAPRRWGWRSGWAWSCPWRTPAPRCHWSWSRCCRSGSFHRCPLSGFCRVHPSPPWSRVEGPALGTVAGQCLWPGLLPAELEAFRAGCWESATSACRLRGAAAARGSDQQTEAAAGSPESCWACWTVAGSQRGQRLGWGGRRWCGSEGGCRASGTW